MDQFKKIKISDLTNDHLKVEELAVVTGGHAVCPLCGEDPCVCGGSDGDGCYTGVCVNNRDVGTSMCTNAVCTSGIGVCHNNT